MEVPSNKSYVSPVLRRVFSRNHLFPSSSTLLNEKGNSRMSPRSDSRMSARSAGKNDLVIDVMTEENVQFMDQPLRGKVELSNLTSAIENVSISLKGVVKACIAGNAAWASGFGGDSNVMARYTEREILKQEFTLHPCTQPVTPLAPGKCHTLPFVFLFPNSANLPPSMTFPQALGCVEYTLNVVLKGKKKFGGSKKWTTTQLLKVEIGRNAIGAKLEQLGVADATLGNTKHIIILEHPRIILPGYSNHYFTLHFPQGLLQVHTFEATLVQKSFYKALGGNYRGASMVGLVCRVGQSEMDVREAGMERIHVEIQEINEDGIESSVEVDGIIERKHYLRIEANLIVFKRGIEKILYEVPVTVQCAAVPSSHIDRRGTMSSMTSASSSNLRYLSEQQQPQHTALRASRSLNHFPNPPTTRINPLPAFDASPPDSPTEPITPSRLETTRMNSKTWRDELPGIAPNKQPPQLASPVKLESSRSRRGKNWTLIKPGVATLDQLSLAAPTPPPTCPIPEPPVQFTSPGIAPVIPPRSSSRLASARHALPSNMSRTSSSTDETGRRSSQDTVTASSVTSSPSEYSERSSASTAATSVVSSPAETAPLKVKAGQLSLRKIEEMGSGAPLREGFDARMYRVGDHKEQARRLEFQRRIDLALFEVEKLALEESADELSDGENEAEEQVLAPALKV